MRSPEKPSRSDAHANPSAWHGSDDQGHGHTSADPRRLAAEAGAARRVRYRPQDPGRRARGRASRGRAGAQAQGRRSARVAVFALLVLGLCGYLYMDRPEWLFPAPPLPRAPPCRRPASGSGWRTSPSTSSSIASAPADCPRRSPTPAPRWTASAISRSTRPGTSPAPTGTGAHAHVPAAAGRVRRPELRPHRPETAVSRLRRGFTFIEVLVVVLVLSILASLAILRYIDLKHRALSAVPRPISRRSGLRPTARGTSTASGRPKWRPAWSRRASSPICRSGSRSRSRSIGWTGITSCRRTAGPPGRCSSAWS